MLIQARWSSATHPNNNLSLETHVTTYLLLLPRCCNLLEVVAVAAGVYIYSLSSPSKQLMEDVSQSF